MGDLPAHRFRLGCVFGLFELVEYTGRHGVDVIPLRLVATAMHATTASVIGLSVWSPHRGRMVVAAALFTTAVIYHWAYNMGAVTGNIALYACMALLSASVAVAVA